MNRLLRINLLFFIFVFTASAGYGQVAVNNDNSSPDASAMLDVKSVTSGFLLPRMLASERTGISNPATGLIVYQTDSPSGFYYFDGSIWIKLSEATVETDPVFSVWNKSTGISISSAQISNFNTAVAAAPVVVTNTAKNSYPANDATKLNGIEAGAEVNVNADWNAVSGDAVILNKPALGGLQPPGDATQGDVLYYDGSNWVARTLVIQSNGSTSAIDNYQPYLGIAYCIATQGIFPARNSSSPFIGEICMFPYTFYPRGFLYCNGQLLSISSNTALFSLLGTMYGGNGQSTFAVPNLQGRVPIHHGQGPGLSLYEVGEQSGTPTITLTGSQLPLHTHSIIYQ